MRNAPIRWSSSRSTPRRTSNDDSGVDAIADLDLPSRARQTGDAASVEPAQGCVLFLGTLEPRKNLDVLLDAYERVLAAAGTRPVPPLVLAGRATPEADAIVARATRAPLAGHVELPGYIDPDAARELYERALVFVLPSHTEGFGMPALEAMTVGVPVDRRQSRRACPKSSATPGNCSSRTTPEALADRASRLS